MVPHLLYPLSYTPPECAFCKAHASLEAALKLSACHAQELHVCQLRKNKEKADGKKIPKEETANAREKTADEREGHKHDNVEIKDPRLPEVQA